MPKNNKGLSIDERLAALRGEMAKARLDAYLVPSNDPHQSEYVARHWESRAWISGFTGSAGIAVITPDHAGLWTDSRYFLQAEQQLANSEFALHRQKVPYAPEHIGWLLENLPEGSTIGCDGNVFSMAQLRSLHRRLAAKGIYIAHEEDLIGRVWGSRPPLPHAPAFELDVAYAGLSRAKKIRGIRERMNDAGYYLVSTLDDIAWLLNIRGADVPFNPVCISYLIVGKNTVYWFVDEEKVPDALMQRLEKDGVEVHPYEAVDDFLGEISAKEDVLYNPASTSARLYEALPQEQWQSSPNLIQPLKAVKNDTEIKHIRQAMRKDGAALVKLYRWLDDQLKESTVSEYELGRQLGRFRKQQGEYFGESFSAIVGYGANGAIVHYRAEEDSCAQIRPEGILLLDSGGQYQEGTTDITRTVSLGKATDEQRLHYTLVLKGHIALAQAVFPEGTTGVQLDILARQYLWKAGLNYGHGTGHGVGFFLNVHEPPQGITPNPNGERGTTAFRAGMLTSNEPGFYKTGSHGIRIENLVLCVRAEGMEMEQEQFLRFESLTLFPISTQLLDLSLLSEEERVWLNDYHRKVFQELAPLLNEEEQEWLAVRCQAI